MPNLKLSNTMLVSGLSIFAMNKILKDYYQAATKGTGHYFLLVT